MVGKYDIRVGDKLSEFRFTLKRKFTFIEGATGVGKSLLVSIIDSYENDRDRRREDKRNPFAYIKSDLRFYVADSLQEVRMACNSDIIDVVVIDENNMVNTHEFWNIVKRARQYFLIISRDSIKKSYGMYETYNLVEDYILDGKKYYKLESVRRLSQC